MPGNPFTDFHPGPLASGDGYHKLFSALNTPVFIADAVTGMLLDANPKASELIGIPIEKIRTMHQTELHPEKDRERARDAFQNLVFKGGGKAVVPVVKSNGDIIHIEVNASIVRLDGAAVVLGIFEDISKNEKMQKALREAHKKLEQAVLDRTESFLVSLHKQKRELEERYRAFLESTHGMAFRTLMDFTPVLYIGGVKAITGYENDDFASGRIRWDQIVHPEDVDRLMALKKQFRAAPGHAVNIEIRLVRKDGDVRWVHLLARSFRDEAGKAVGIEGTIVDISDRKRIESLLHDSEKQYRTLVENINVGVYRNTASPKGRFLYANASFARMFGHESPAEIVGKSVASLYENPHDRKAFLEEIHEKGFFNNRELRLKKNDGTPILCSVTGIANRDPGGAIRWIDGIIEDVTGRKQAEAALRESEARYRTVFENTGTAMIVIEADTTISLANNEFTRLTGYSKQETEHILTWKNIVPADDRKRLEGYHKLRRKSPEAAPTRYETRILDRFGNVKDCLVAIDVILGTGKSVASIFDITQQKKLDRELRESEERFRIVFESAKDLIFIKDTASRYVAINPAMAAVFGLPVSQLLSKTDEEMLGKKAGRFVRSVEKRVFAGEIVEDEYYQPIRGRGYHFHVIRVPLRDASGKIVGIFGIARDATDRKRAEAELLRQAKELEDYNAALRILLKNREQERMDLEKKILSNIHELVFPYLDKLKRHGVNPSGERYVDIIERTLEEATSSFAHRLTAKQHTLTAKEVQVANLIREGKSTKDIAQILGLSHKTIEFYRNSIRTKLGLKDKKSHLRSHLLGLSKP